MRDTIAAIATATGGGVGMVRLSGPQALAVAGRVFRPMNPAKSPETMPGYTGAFGTDKRWKILCGGVLAIFIKFWAHVFSGVIFSGECAGIP